MAHGFKARKTKRYTKDNYIDYATNIRQLRGEHDGYFNH
jgi:hypothetical protein